MHSKHGCSTPRNTAVTSLPACSVALSLAPLPLLLLCRCAVFLFRLRSLQSRLLLFLGRCLLCLCALWLDHDTDITSSLALGTHRYRCTCEGKDMAPIMCCDLQFAAALHEHSATAVQLCCVLARHMCSDKRHRVHSSMPQQHTHAIEQLTSAL